MTLLRGRKILSSPAACPSCWIPAFLVLGRHSEESLYETRGKAVSGGHTTSQLARPDFSKSVARYGTARSPRERRAIPSSLGSDATDATVGFVIRCRTPARRRVCRDSDRVAISSSHSRSDRTFSSSQNPGSLISSQIHQ